ncbi:MAG: hypothetical protein HY720_26675 [Planctomycetes bacterium]|nr:hypothetical protein [Planctomycetota bacterium]
MRNLDLTVPGLGGPFWDAVIVGLALAAAYVSYRRIFELAHSPAGAKGPWVLLAARSLAVGAILLFLLAPILSWEREDSPRGRVVVLVDTSGSMAVSDGPDGARRLDAARRILSDPDRGILEPLKDLYEVEVYAFDAGARRLAGAESLEGLDPAGPATDVREALARSRESGEAQAVVLVSDGRETTTGSARELARAGAPIHAVGIGSLASGDPYAIDLAVADLRAPRTALVRNRIAFLATIRCSAPGPVETALELRRAGAVLATRRIELSPGSAEEEIEFLPIEPGAFEFEVRVVPVAGEAIEENNSRFVGLSVSAEKVRVLCYETTLRWKYTYLKRALEQDENVMLACLVRTGPARASFQGSSPVDLADGFPATRAALQVFDCLVLGDLAATDLTEDEWKLVRDYVSEAGGGLLLLPGKKAAGPAGLGATALAPALPVALSGATEHTGDLAIAVTAEGTGHAILAGLGPFPHLASVLAPVRLAPGATPLALWSGADSEGLLLVERRYGEGRVAIFLSEADWQWARTPAAKTFEALWGQSVRWAARRDQDGEAGGSGFALRAAPRLVPSGEPVLLTVTGAPEGSQVRVQVVSPDGAVADVELAAGEGTRSGTFRPTSPGEHAAVAREGSREARASFVALRPAGEMDEPFLDEHLLRDLARDSGGAYYTVLDAHRIPEALERSRRTSVERVEHSAGDSPVLFAVFVLLLSCEWALRRWMQIL